MENELLKRVGVTPNLKTSKKKETKYKSEKKGKQKVNVNFNKITREKNRLNGKICKATDFERERNGRNQIAYKKNTRIKEKEKERSKRFYIWTSGKKNWEITKRGELNTTKKKKKNLLRIILSRNVNIFFINLMFYC